MGGANAYCPDCRGRKGLPKKIPYGAKRTRCWCDACDRAFIPPQPNKKGERQKAKREIKKTTLQSLYTEKHKLRKSLYE